MLTREKLVNIQIFMTRAAEHEVKGVQDIMAFAETMSDVAKEIAAIDAAAVAPIKKEKTK